MSKEVSLEFLLLVFAATAFDNCSDIWWRTDGEYAPVTVFVSCNDQFYWACADCEEVTPGNVDELERAYLDAGKAEGRERGFYGSALFCSRVRKMRPQLPYYKGMPEALAKLFDECGPPRDPKECG